MRPLNSLLYYSSLPYKAHCPQSHYFTILKTLHSSGVLQWLNLWTCRWMISSRKTNKRTMVDDVPEVTSIKSAAVCGFMVLGLVGADQAAVAEWRPTQCRRYQAVPIPFFLACKTNILEKYCSVFQSQTRWWLEGQSGIMGLSYLYLISITGSPTMTSGYKPSFLLFLNKPTLAQLDCRVSSISHMKRN